MTVRPRTTNRQSRPEKGRALFYHRDSGGKHETTPGEYVIWAQNYSIQHGLNFDGTPDRIMEMIRSGAASHGDLFLDWDVSGNVIDRVGLNKFFAEVERDCSVSHVLIPRPDRLARPEEIEIGVAYERRIRQHLGADLIFTNRECRRIRRGESMGFGEWVTSAAEYEQAAKFRIDLADKMIRSAIARAKEGYSTGGRARYGYSRWLMGPNQVLERKLKAGEFVRGAGYHVVQIPSDNGTFEVRMRIKNMLLSMTATQVARQLNHEGVLPPDAGRFRTDNGILHQTSGLWHETTITNIGRDPMDSGVTEYGRRSMGDSLRFSPDGPRELKDDDFLANGSPKVVRNPEEQVIKGTAHFSPQMTKDSQEKLTEILNKPRRYTTRKAPLSIAGQESTGDTHHRLGLHLADVPHALWRWLSLHMRTLPTEQWPKMSSQSY